MDDDDEQPVLDTVGGELAFFRSITRFRPVGMHRFFHVLSIQQTIKRDTGVDVPVDLIWAKLDMCYDLDAIEGLEIDGYDSSDSDSSQPHSIPSPVPGENLMAHPHFRSEFELPWSEYDPLMAMRRMSDTSPPASPVIFTRRKTKVKTAHAASERTPSRRGSLMAGLVGGDSDSSALTESGEEAMEVDQGSARQSRRNSVITGTPTEEMAEDDEGAEPADSPALEAEEDDGGELLPPVEQAGHRREELGGDKFDRLLNVTEDPGPNLPQVIASRRVPRSTVRPSIAAQENKNAMRSHAGFVEPPMLDDKALLLEGFPSFSAWH